MGIDYIINYACAIKEQLGSEETLNFIKTKAQFDFLRQMIGQPGYENLNMFSNIRYQVLNNGQFINQTAPLKDLENYLEAFRQLMHHCENCPANLSDCNGGCWGYINYPVRPFVESFFIWAVEYLIDLEINKSSGLLIKYIIENDIKPDIIPKLRKDGNFELNKPLEYKWGKLISRKKVDSDQILEMLFCFQIDYGSALLISSFLSRCQEIFPQWLDSFIEIVINKNPELSATSVQQEISNTIAPYFQYGESCSFAFYNKKELIVLT